MTIFVGSTNPVKINAVKQATAHIWPKAQIQGIEVETGIAEQPLSDEETRLGAKNRARAALELGLGSDHRIQSALGIGLEGGVMEFEGDLWSTVWVAVIDQSGKIFESNGARFKLPDNIAEGLRFGQELGPLIGDLTQDKDMKQKAGAIGVLTQGFVDRTSEYAAIAQLAIGLWYGRDWEQQLKASL